MTQTIQKRRDDLAKQYRQDSQDLFSATAFQSGWDACFAEITKCYGDPERFDKLEKAYNDGQLEQEKRMEELRQIKGLLTREAELPKLHDFEQWREAYIKEHGQEPSCGAGAAWMKEICEAKLSAGEQIDARSCMCPKYLARIVELEASLKDADFVLEGSIAMEGQSDDALEARENALMRFLEQVGKLAPK